MNELKELESGITRLKRESQNKKILIDALEKEKKELLRKSEEMSERIRKLNDSYRESYRKIMEHVNSQVNQLKMDISGLSNSISSINDIESRLEDQESRHEKAIAKLEKELLLVEKSLSDVERLKAELSRQRAFFQEAKLQMEKSIQSGMAYLRKEMDVNRKEDARRALEEFKEEIERIASIEKELNAYKRSHESRMERIIEELSSVKSSIAELRLLKEKSRSIEEVTDSLVNRVAEISSQQKAVASLIENKLAKRMDNALISFKKELESRRSEDIKQRLEDFKQELQRIASLEQSLAENSKRLDALGRELSSLRPLADEIDIIREKTDESIHMNRSLAERVVNTSDFERAMRAISKRTEEIENKLFLVDKKLSADKNRLEREILDVLNKEKFLEATQENVKRWFDAQVADMEKRISSGMDALATQMEEGSAVVNRLKERSQKMDMLTKDVPKKLEEHSRRIMELLDAKAGIAATLESLSGDAKALSSGLAASLERIAALEKGLASNAKSGESRLSKLSEELSSYRNDVIKLSDAVSSALERLGSVEKNLSSFDKANRTAISRLSSDLSGFQQELKNQAVLLREFSESGRADISKMRLELGASIKRISKEMESRIRESHDSIRREMRDGIRGLVSSKDMASELKVLKSLIAGIDARGRGIAARLAADIDDARKSLESRLSELSEEQAARFRKDFDFITKNIDSIRDLAADIKIYKSKVSSIERVMKTKLSDDDFKRFSRYMESRLSDIEASGKKAIDKLSHELDALRSDIESGKVSRDEFLKQIELINTKISDIGVMAGSSSETLSKELSSFKKLVADRFNEIKSSHLRELKDGLKRISQLEQSVETTAAVHEKRIDHLSEALSSLQAVPAEISVIKEKLESVGKLSASAVQNSDFSSRISEINSALIRLQTELARVDNGMKSQRASLEAAIEEALGEEKLIKKSHEAMGKIIDSRITELDRKLSSIIQNIAKELSKRKDDISAIKGNLSVVSAVSKRIADGESSLENLKERIAGLELLSRETSKKASVIDDIVKRLSRLEMQSRNISENSELLKKLEGKYGSILAITKTLPSTVDKHSDAINKILESKEFLAESVSSIRSDVKAVSDGLSSSAERISALEKTLSGIMDSKESRLDDISYKVRALDAKLDSSTKKMDEFRTHILDHVNNVLDSYEKRFDKLSSSLSASGAGKEKSLAAFTVLKEKVAEIESLTRKLSETHVPEKEFVETIRSVSKRIDELEKSLSKIDKKTAVSEARLEEAVKKALSNDDVLNASQKTLENMLNSRMKEIERRISEQVSSQLSGLRSVASDIESLKKQVSGIALMEKNIDAGLTEKIVKGMEELTSIRESVDRRIGALTGELKSMNERLMEERSRVSSLEQRLKSFVEKQDMKMKEMLRKQKAMLDNEISEEAAKALKDAEIGELKRKREFENLLRKFQEMHIKTQQNLDAISGQRESFLQLERNLRERLDKATSAAQKRLSSEQERLRKRLDDSENLIMKLNNMISELQIRIEKGKDAERDIDGIISELKEELMERMKTNEEMFDSEMDAFRKRLDAIVAQAPPGLSDDFKRLSDRLAQSESMIANLNGAIAEIQAKLKNTSDFRTELDKALSNLESQIDSRLRTMDTMINEFNAWKEAHKSRIESLPDAERRQLVELTKSIEDLNSRLKSNKDEMSKFKEYVIEHVNNLVNTYEGRMRSLRDDIEGRIRNMK